MKAFIVVPVFNPSQRHVENVRAMSKLAPVVAVDDGSPAGAAANLDALAASEGVLLLRCADNAGIASALNHGVRAAIDAGAQWIFTFDQDSAPENDHILRVLDCLRSGDGSVGLVGPGSIAGRPDRAFRLSPASDTAEVAVAIQSGVGMSAATFHAIGPFAEDLFIDGVDTEYCLRAAVQHGLRTVLIRDLDLPHTLGGGEEGTRRINVLGRSLAATGHSPLRRYYVNRNAVHLLRRYATRRPAWAAEFVLRTTAFNVAALLMETDKWRKFRAMMAGIRDGVMGRTGPMRQRVTT